jgi:phage gp36-like protein
VAIATADGDIVGYLQERYALPLSSTPEIIKNISVDLAIYWLYSRRDIDNPVRTARNKDALAKLRGIAEGKISLGLASPESETGGSIQSTTEDTDRIFDGDTMANF